jgi:signal transduction histidine kinase
MTEVLPDIPRLLTGVAEWMACLVYLVWRPRFTWPRMVIIALVALAVQVGVQWVAGQLPLALWVPGMVVAVGTMLAFLASAGRILLKTACYLTARAFVLAEFAAALHWQLYCLFLPRSASPYGLPLVTGVVMDALILGLALLLEARHARGGVPLAITTLGLWSSAAIAVVTFAISNLSFMTTGAPFTASSGFEVFYIRTLVDLCGWVVLYAQDGQLLAHQAIDELSAIQGLLRSQHQQYLMSKRSIDAVQRAYHDLKHQIQVIRAEADPGQRARHLAELEESVGDYGTLVRTGNSVLDVILTAKGMECLEHHIDMVVVADGAVLEFMSPADIATVFGNALDNAIAATRRLADPAERVIKVAVFSKAAFAVITVENSFTGELRIEDGTIVTLNKDRRRHGFGLKSIRFVVDKHAGTMTAHREGNWFVLRVLLPCQTLPQQPMPLK